MTEAIKNVAKHIYRFLTHRILWLFVLTAVLFSMLFIKLFALQIVETDRWLFAPLPNIKIELPLQPLRGTIYDRHGRPLAVNNLVFVVKMDPSVSISNDALLELAHLFERNGERAVFDFPIALPEAPGGEFEFTFTGNESTRAQREYRWKHDMAIPNHGTATAEESFLHLRRHFRIDPALCDEDTRRILNFRCQIFMLRLIDFRNYSPSPIVFATDVSHGTMAVISEMGDLFTGIFIDIQTQREYPGGRYVSHIIGYVGSITEGQYRTNRHLGYTQQDLFGRSGLENALELAHLRGTPGVQRIEVNRAGRRVGTPEIVEAPVPGDRVFLSIDLELQQAAYYSLLDYLSEMLIGRLHLRPQEGELAPQELSMEDAFISLVRSGNLSIRDVLDAEPENEAYPLRLYINERIRNPSVRGDGLANIQRVVIEGLETGRISPAQMLLTLIGTEQLQDPDGLTAARLTARPQDALPVLTEGIRARELTPQMFNTDPSTGSVVILDVHTGGVLAAVSYPSFDNNNMATVADFAYFNRLNNDPTRPMWYRALMEPRAPGSTFKMIPAIAALEAGTIGANTTITSNGHFRIGDEPNPLQCWAWWGHGPLNVGNALAVSCNVFFAEAVFRLGNARNHTTRGTQDAIEYLNGYMAYFGLHEHTGTELWERYDAVRAGGYQGLLLPSPELNRHIFNNAPWLDINNAQVAIGQDISNYTPAQMARFMMGLANRNTPYPLHFVRMVEGREGGLPVDRRTAPEMPEPELHISDATWDTVINGMRLATEGNAGGTAVELFRDFPVQVAGKTGTAEEIRGRFEHLAFGAFAPLHDPQIAIYVNVPFSGANRAMRQISTRIAHDMIGVALGIGNEPETPLPLNTVRP
jgi:cell division protein FtsI/penicillin-binding protein 2